MEYRSAWTLQKALHAQVAAGERRDIWLFVEHEPVVTLGRNTRGESLKLSEEALAARGIDFLRVERGGDATFHGPGQLIVYPIMRLERFREVVPLVRALEGALIRLCAELGVTAERWSEHAGIWVGAAQICALGLAIQKMTSLHGLALNCSMELNYDELITPCGLPERGITSLSRELGRLVSVEEVRPHLRAALATTFDTVFHDSLLKEIGL
jgi:lipoyl(octanoyl) transferase